MTIGYGYGPILRLQFDKKGSGWFFERYSNNSVRGRLDIPTGWVHEYYIAKL
jgi:hypothetical protein